MVSMTSPLVCSTQLQQYELTASLVSSMATSPAPVPH